MYHIINAEIYNEKKKIKGGITVNRGVITAIGDIEVQGKVIDAKGMTILPGLIDMHVHLREPGLEYKEDILTGAKAAVKGGFTQIACMPNTKPVCDNAQIVSYIKQRAKEVNLAKIHPIGAITKGEEGKSLAEMGGMKAAGAVAVSDDGKPVPDAETMRLALEYASDFELLPLSHCEEKSLIQGGVVNEGLNSTRAGLRGISRASEEIMVAREIILSETTGKPVHICHISTKGSVQLIRDAKRRGVKVSCETCPHYFAATDDLILSYDPVTKVNPPLRTEEDRLAVIEGIKDGTVDAIATDHAPHHIDEKTCEYEKAAFGISGLETAFALSYTYLVKAGHVNMNRLVELTSTNPAKLLKITGGTIAVGAPADFTVVDLNREYTIDKNKFASKGKNTPFHGWNVWGEVHMTVVDGDVKYKI